MIFYHRTTEAKWKKIQKEGILFGIGNSYRYTCMSPEDWGDSYGTVLLEVDYEPVGTEVKTKEGKAIDNFRFNPPKGLICEQSSVFIPIPLERVKRVTRAKKLDK